MHLNLGTPAIDEHTTVYGVDVRPQLEVGSLDREHLHEFGRWAREEYANLYESQIIAPGVFRMQKKFVFAGKGDAEVPTFEATKRGPVFRFPRRIGAFQEDVEAGDPRATFLHCLDAFKKCFPTKKVVRVGVIQEMVLATGEDNAQMWLAERITSFNTDELDEVRLRLRYKRTGHNIVLELRPVVAQQTRVDPVTRQAVAERVGYGLACRLDINNAETTAELDDEGVRGVLDFAHEFFASEFFPLLTGGAH